MKKIIIGAAALAVAIPVTGCGAGEKKLDTHTYEQQIQDAMTQRLAEGDDPQASIDSVSCIQKDAHDLSCIADGQDSSGSARLLVHVDVASDGRAVWHVTSTDYQ